MRQRRERMLEDRHIRDAALALVSADWKNLRADLSVKSVSERAVDRLSQGASDVYDEALEVASEHKGALTVIVAALALWLARHPILERILGEHQE